MTSLKIDRTKYKVGINEIKGLKLVLTHALKPVQALIKDQAYWSDVEITETEYMSRDGFIPYSSNCGGVEISLIIPKCEEDSFRYLSFGECDMCGTAECVNEQGEAIQCGYKGMECASDGDGCNDAKLRVWLKFEGLDDDGTMKFYLYCGGGNGDAPYFRTKYEATIFESEFTAKTLVGVHRKATAAVKKLMKQLEAA